MHEMITDFLQSIGLNEKEIRLYVLLFRYGTQATSVLARHAELSRSTAYSTLQRLEQKGLVSETKNGGVQFFTALDPSQLLQYLDHQILSITQTKKKAMTAIDELTNLHNPLQRRPRVEMFSGKEGAKLALLKTLQSKTKTLYAFTSLFDLADRLGEDFIADYTKKRVKSKRRLKILRTRKAYKKALHSRSPKHAYDTDAKELREVKYISDELDFSLGMYLFDQSVVILSSKEENYALVIESNDLSRLLKGMFELLWNILPTETMPTKRSGTR